MLHVAWNFRLLIELRIFTGNCGVEIRNIIFTFLRECLTSWNSFFISSDQLQKNLYLIRLTKSERIIKLNHGIINTHWIGEAFKFIWAQFERSHALEVTNSEIYNLRGFYIFPWLGITKSKQKREYDNWSHFALIIILISDIWGNKLI